ncbi:MAG: MarR family transcriptional regulator [Gammaproteobacteria bacterium]|nr:MarR family transcriptional regulator [Gammaproteobacteria bacterium]
MTTKPRDTSKTIQERIAATHVNELGVDLGAMAVISNIFRVSVLFHNQAEKRFLVKHKLTFSGFTVLWVLWVFGRMESYQLAEECGISKGTLTGIVNTLEKHGFAERKPHSTDGRRRFVQLTRKGRSLMKELFLAINALEREFVSELNQTEITEASRMLRIILHTQDNLT